MFDNHSRTHYDNINITEEDVVNNKTMQYNLYNGHRSSINMALNQPNVNFGNNIEIANTVDTNSKLLLNQKQYSINHDKSSMQEPIFYSRPYLGKGVIDADIETVIRNGENYRDKKFYTKVNEKKSHVHQSVPLLNNVKDSLANPSNFVQENSDKHWIRGGLPTRSLVKS